MTKQEATIQILALAQEHSVLTLVIDDHNPNLKIDCFNPHGPDMNVNGKVVGTPVTQGSDLLEKRVLQLEIHLHDSFKPPIVPPSMRN